MHDRILRLPEVKQLVGISRTQIYARMADGSFPRAVKIGARSVGWLASSIDEFIRECAEKSAA